jgi:hypothetical protein
VKNEKTCLVKGDEIYKRPFMVSLWALMANGRLYVSSEAFIELGYNGLSQLISLGHEPSVHFLYLLEVGKH